MILISLNVQLAGNIYIWPRTYRKFHYTRLTSGNFVFLEFFLFLFSLRSNLSLFCERLFAHFPSILLCILCSLTVRLHMLINTHLNIPVFFALSLSALYYQKMMIFFTISIKTTCKVDVYGANAYQHN